MLRTFRSSQSGPGLVVGSVQRPLQPGGDRRVSLLWGEGRDSLGRSLCVAWGETTPECFGTALLPGDRPERARTLPVARFFLGAGGLVVGQRGQGRKRPGDGRERVDVGPRLLRGALRACRVGPRDAEAARFSKGLPPGPEPEEDVACRPGRRGDHLRAFLRREVAASDCGMVGFSVDAFDIDAELGTAARPQRTRAGPYDLD